MSKVTYLSECHMNILRKLFTNSGSFLVRYPEPRPNNAHSWFFVLNTESKHSDYILSSICEYLVERDFIVPELSDDEYAVQLAVGAIDYRTYKLSSSMNSELKRAGTLRTFDDSEST